MFLEAKINIEKLTIVQNNDMQMFRGLFKRSFSAVVRSDIRLKQEKVRIRGEHVETTTVGNYISRNFTVMERENRRGRGRRTGREGKEGRRGRVGQTEVKQRWEEKQEEDMRQKEGESGYGRREGGGINLRYQKSWYPWLMWLSGSL